MTLSRSIIWTLTQRRAPAPTVDMRAQMAAEVHRTLAKVGEPHYKRAAEAIGPTTFFADDSYERVVRLLAPRNASGESSDQFLAALMDVDSGADREFAPAAIAQWVMSDDDPSGRLQRLRESDILELLEARGTLSHEMVEYLLRLPGKAATVGVPRDFCDDTKKGLELGLEPRLWNARKVCYGVFAEDFPFAALSSTDPAQWHAKCPKFWLRSDVRATRPVRDEKYEYQAGLLTEEVNLTNMVQPFGPVVLMFERTTALDGCWSFVTYRLADQNAMRVNEGWYLVQRRPDAPDAAIMVKLVEFYGNNDWLDSVCASGLLQSARALVGVDIFNEARRETGAGRETSTSAGAKPDSVLAGVMTNYLDEYVDRWDNLARRNAATIKGGLAEFEAKPLRFGWLDNALEVVRNSVAFVSSSASSWASIVQHELPEALSQTEAAAADRTTTPAHLVAAGWKTTLGIYKVGNDIARAMLQVVGPGASNSDTALVKGLDQLVGSGGLADFLDSCGVADLGAAYHTVFSAMRAARTVEELDRELDDLLRGMASRPPEPEQRSAFTRELWARRPADDGDALGEPT